MPAPLAAPRAESELRLSINLSACQLAFLLTLPVFSSGVLFSCTSSDMGISSSLSLPSSVHTSSCRYRFGEGAHSQFSKLGLVSGLHLSKGGLILPLFLSLSHAAFSLFKELYWIKQTEKGRLEKEVSKGKKKRRRVTRPGILPLPLGRTEKYRLGILDQESKNSTCLLGYSSRRFKNLALWWCDSSQRNSMRVTKPEEPDSMQITSICCQVAAQG